MLNTTAMCSHYLQRNINSAGKLRAGPAPLASPVQPSEDAVSTGATNGGNNGGGGGDGGTAVGSATGAASKEGSGTSASKEKFKKGGSSEPARRLLSKGGDGNHGDGGKRTKFNPEDPDFQESNLMHGMNGFVYGNMPVRSSQLLHA